MNCELLVSSNNLGQLVIHTVLFKMNMTAVAYQAQRWPQKSIWPMSQMSRTSGCRRQNCHRTSDLPTISMRAMHRRGRGATHV